MSYFYGKATNLPFGSLSGLSKSCCSSCAKGAPCATGDLSLSDPTGLLMLGAVVVGGIMLMKRIAK